MVEFVAWEKTPRYFRDIVITEKIDGTNAAVVIEEAPYGFGADERTPEGGIVVDTPEGLVVLAAQSRRRLITPESDNRGFARWVHENRETIVNDLGIGRHFGEWWGQGIQSGYGLSEKVFSLFNTRKWMHTDFTTPNMMTVPILYIGPHSELEVRDALQGLREFGSAATEDFNGSTFRRPEGICIFHTAANRVFKVTLESDEQPKSVAA